MNPKVPSIAAFCLILVAGGLVLLSRSNDRSPSAPEGPGKAGEADDIGPARTGRLEVRSERNPEEDATAMEQLAIVERDRMVGLWLETASKGFGLTTKHLVTDLELSDGKAKGVEEVFARREKELAELLVKMSSDEKADGNEVVKKICALIRNKGLREDLVGVLSSGELAAFDTMEAKRERETVEARAYRDMAEVNAVVQLDDSQKQEVLGVLMGQAAERVEQEADARAFMSLTYGQLATDMNSSHIRGLANMFHADLAETPALDDYGSAGHLQWIEKQKAERIESELSALGEVLDDEQLARYRRHLEAQAPR